MAKAKCFSKGLNGAKLCELFGNLVLPHLFGSGMRMMKSDCPMGCDFLEQCCMHAHRSLVSQHASQPKSEFGKSGATGETNQTQLMPLKFWLFGKPKGNYSLHAMIVFGFWYMSHDLLIYS